MRLWLHSLAYLVPIALIAVFTGPAPWWVIVGEYVVVLIFIAAVEATRHALWRHVANQSIKKYEAR